MSERCPVTDKIDCQDRMCELHYMGAPVQIDPGVCGVCKTGHSTGYGVIYVVERRDRGTVTWYDAGYLVQIEGQEAKTLMRDVSKMMRPFIQWRVAAYVVSSDQDVSPEYVSTIGAAGPRQITR